MTLIALLTLEIPFKFTIVPMSRGLKQDGAREVPSGVHRCCQAFRATHADGEPLERADTGACSLPCSLLALFTRFYASNPR